MILLENLKELHKIDMSILSKFMDDASYRSAKRNEKIKQILDYYKITADSKIYVEPLKAPAGSGEKRHTWKYATEQVLMNDDVAGIILRSNKRQLMGIFKRNGYYYYAFADMAENLNNSSEYYENSVSNTGSLISIRNKMSKVVKSFIETYPNAKKNWDIIVINKDESFSEKRTSRFNTRKGMEYKPQDKENYENYIKILKDNLATRLVQYVNSKIPDTATEEQLKDIITNAPNIFVKKLKIVGFIYELVDTSADISRGNERFNIICTYDPKVAPNGERYSYSRYSYSGARRLTITYNTIGKEIKLGDIKFDGVDFVEGITNLLNERDRLNNQSQS